jgi:hypothetical protein
MPETDDDPFESIVSGLTLDVDITDDVLNVQTLSNQELIDMLIEITDEITKEKSLFRNHTEWQRDQHSLRAAIMVELSRRGLS